MLEFYVYPIKLIMLCLIGLGLYDEEDISLKGLRKIKECDVAYAELYTSPWQGDLKKLEEEASKKITLLERPDLEENSAKLIEEAKNIDVCVLVPGDPLVATTHSALIMDARKQNIKVEIIHASSVFSAIAETGLHIYKFGKTATVAFPQKNFFPKTPVEVLEQNMKNKLHTLLLLDVKREEDRYMTISEAIEVLLELNKVFKKDTLCVGVARIGGGIQVKAGAAEELKEYDFGNPPHVLIVPSELHFSEKEYLLG
jgi:diphthine synthase